MEIVKQSLTGKKQSVKNGVSLELTDPLCVCLRACACMLVSVRVFACVCVFPCVYVHAQSCGGGNEMHLNLCVAGGELCVQILLNG